MRQVGY